jgi:hypothetical protein
MSDPESHEITLNRAKEEPVPASFPGVVLLFYQNNLWSASTKIALPGVHSMTPVYWPVPELSRSLRLGGWLPGKTERFQSEASSGTAEGAEWPEPTSQRKRHATAPSSSRNERARSKVVARASGAITERGTRWFRWVLLDSFAPKKSSSTRK